jgi:hypothetical protein
MPHSMAARSQENTQMESSTMPKKAKRPAPRKPPEFTVPIKLWVNPEMYAALQALAADEERTIPQVIRRAVRAALKLG